MSRHYKTTIELTEKQLEYLSVAFFEFGESFNADKERMFKVVDKKLDEATLRIKKEKKYYAEKNYYKAEMKARNSRGEK